MAIMFWSINRFTQFYLQAVKIMQDFETLFLSFVAVLDKSENSWFVDLWPKGTFNHWDLDRTPYKESTEADWGDIVQKKVFC